MMVKKDQVPKSTEATEKVEDSPSSSDEAEELIVSEKTGEKDSVNGDIPAKPAKGGAPSEEKKTPKPLKKIIPAWASVDRTKISTAMLPKPKVLDIVIHILKNTEDPKGVVSAGTVRKLVLQDNPDLPKIALKKAIDKGLERGIIKQVTGSGFSGSFKLEKEKPVKKGGKTKKTAAYTSDKVPLENQFPNVFTWACNPKEASVGLIRKYLVKHYPGLDVETESKYFKTALEFLENQGQLERITGKGFSGTFQLVDDADKSGNKYEDAIANAIIAMNEPKDVSVNAIRDYFGEYHKEYNTDNRPFVLKNALDRAVKKGWLKQVTGKGFSGTFRLMHSFHPSPKELWGDDYVETEVEDNEPTPKEAPVQKEAPKKETPKRKATKKSATESDEDVDAEVMPSPRKRGAPTQRKYAGPEKKAKKEVKKAPAKKAAKPVALKKGVATEKSKPAPKKVKGKVKK